MNERDFVKIAFQFKQSSIVPYTSLIPLEIEGAITSYYGGEQWKVWQREYAQGISAVSHTFDDKELTFLNKERSRFLDHFGCVWRNAFGNTDHLVEHPLKEAAIGNYRLPDLNDYYKNYAHNRILRQLNEAEGKFKILGHTFGLFERAWSLRGFENFLQDLCLEEKFCEELIEMIADWMLESVENMLNYPVDAVMFTDDYADERGMIFGIERFRKFFKPHWKRLFARVRKAGVYSILHVCGNALPAVPDLIESGLDCLESLQPEAMDVYKTKREFGRDIRMWGGVGIQRLLTFGTPGEVQEEVRRLKCTLGEGGGYMLGPTKAFNRVVPPANIVAYLKEAAEPM
jgi:uroporphyrinogen decarboxylase